MENLEVQNVVKELCEGRELTMQLQTHLHHRSSHQNLEFLLDGILSSYDHALSILAPPPDSPASPHTEEESDQDQLHASRKRKGVVRWSKKIKVGRDELGGGGGIEGQLDDGYAWRKYGQKDILGAKYPRGYYRCTYRHTQGCLATKQVQKSDDDPTTFEITYRRNHTCANNPPAPAPMPDPQHEDPNPENDQALFNIQTSLRVITQDSPINPQNNHTFSYASTNILENYKPISTNLIPNLRNSESELSPIVAAMTPNTNLGTNFEFGSSEFGSNFSFGNPDFYP